MAYNNEDRNVNSNSTPGQTQGTGNADAQNGRKVIRKVVKSSGTQQANAKPVKKKKIIIVTGDAGNGGGAVSAGGSGRERRSSGSMGGGGRSGGSSGRGGYGTGSQGSRGSQYGGARSQSERTSGSGAYRPIKPKTAPSQMTGDYHKPIPRSDQPARRPETEPAASAAQTQPSAAAAPVPEQSPVQAKAPEISAPVSPVQEGMSAAAGMPEAAESKAEVHAGTAAPVQNTPSQDAAGRGAAPEGEAYAQQTGAMTGGEAYAQKESAPQAQKFAERGAGVGPAGEAEDGSRKSQDRPAARTDRNERGERGSRRGEDVQERTSGQGGSQGGQGRSYSQGGSHDGQGSRSYSQSGSRDGQGRSYSQGGSRDGQGRSYSQSGSRDGQGRSYSQGGSRDGQGRSYSQGGSRDGQGSRSYSQGGSRDGQGRSYSQGGSRDGQGRSYSQGGSRDGQGRSYSQGGSRDGQGRSYGQGGAQGGRGGASAGRGAGVGGNDFNAANQNKRRGQTAAAKDRRNRRDAMLEQNEQNDRRNRAGRFIKPVVEVKEEPEEQIKVITIPEKLTIGALAEAMHLKPAELIKKLFLAGKAMTVNSEVSYEEAENIAADYDILCEKEEKVDVIEELLREDADPEETLIPRPPVICVMGHVDHGKTSILDYIRHSRVTEKEAGGITQAIGAYTVKVQDRMITFLDTPGHEAFTAMRLRGAKSTDIAVLVIAADDGVMPQTVEAINHARAAGVEIIVALNKIDKPEADPEKVKQQLTKYELVPTDWGGSTEFVNVSAKTGEGIDDLLDTILLQADIMELKANPNRLARGLVLEARLDRGRGPVANVLVQKGTLHVGDFISAGPAFGKVRALIDDQGRNVKKAMPSEPVMVLGLSDVPSAGEVIVAHPTNDEAKTYAQTYKAQHKEELVEENVMSMNVEDLFDQMREGKMKELELIVKADVQGSVEALCASLLKLSNDEVRVRIIHSAAGAITESDVDLAAASNAAIIGFNVAPNAIAKSNAEHNGVSIHLYRVIYQAIDDVDAALKGMLAPVYEEKITGHAEVRALFKSGKIGNIAGCMVTDGLAERDAQVRVTRGKEQLFEGELASLKRFKDDVKEVKSGYDCGIVFKGFDAMEVDDQIEFYKMVEVPREEVIARKEREAAKAANKTAQ